MIKKILFVIISFVLLHLQSYALETNIIVDRIIEVVESKNEVQQNLIIQIFHDIIEKPTTSEYLKNIMIDVIFYFSNTISSQEIENNVRSNNWFYTSSHHTATQYYCSNDTSWKWLSEKYLEFYETEQEILAVYPSKTLNTSCY